MRFLYCMEIDGSLKIGVSGNPALRAIELGYKFKSDVKVLFIGTCKDAYKTEAVIHRQVCSFRRETEINYLNCGVEFFYIDKSLARSMFDDFCEEVFDINDTIDLYVLTIHLIAKSKVKINDDGSGSIDISDELMKRLKDISQLTGKSIKDIVQESVRESYKGMFK